MRPEYKQDILLTNQPGGILEEAGWVRDLLGADITDYCVRQTAPPTVDVPFKSYDRAKRKSSCGVPASQLLS